LATPKKNVKSTPLGIVRLCAFFLLLSIILSKRTNKVLNKITFIKYFKFKQLIKDVK